MPTEWRKLTETQRLRMLVKQARSNAKRDGNYFDLKVEDLTVPPLCPVLGILLQFDGPPFSPWLPSLDRMKPELGYVKGNVRVISWRANRLKADCKNSEELRAIADYMDGIDRHPFTGQ